MKKDRRTVGKTRLQVGTVPVRLAKDGQIEIFLVTTRTTRRWTIPKGWPIKGLKSHVAAKREALEEAGALGKMRKKSVGHYLYWKRLADHFTLCKVKVFVMFVEEQLDIWPERNERLRQWFTQRDAADLVEEPGLRAALRSLKFS
jgi:8-oxo-dGTP pyrophosphatase MutT (NUDIX family)